MFSIMRPDSDYLFFLWNSFLLSEALITLVERVFCSLPSPAWPSFTLLLREVTLARKTLDYYERSTFCYSISSYDARLTLPPLPSFLPSFLSFFASCYWFYTLISFFPGVCNLKLLTLTVVDVGYSCYGYFSLSFFWISIFIGAFLVLVVSSLLWISPLITSVDCSCFVLD